MLPTAPAAAGPPSEAPAEDATPSWARLAIGAVLAVGVFARFFAPSHLWLDEALSVNVARLPLGEIPEALRHDGAPPLYYLLLHGWMQVVGQGDLAVRALSGVFGVAALPLMWLFGRRLAGRQVAWISVVLLAACPFAVRYSTEARMYSLVVLLGLVGGVAVLALRDRPSLGPSVVLAAATGLLLLTHYWGFYLVAAAVAVLVVDARARGATAAGARRALAAIAAGSLLFVPWLPSFWYQLRHTGTPWAGPPRLRVLLDAVVDFAGGYWDPGLGLGLLYLALLALGLWGRALDERRIEIDLRGHMPGTALAALCFVTMALAVVVARLSGSAFATRYASVILPFTLVLVALGTQALAWPEPRRGVVAVAAVLGLAAVVPNLVGERTTAPRVAKVLDAQAEAGDVVAYCPDQLGPSVSRLLHLEGVTQLTFPRAGSPELVDWVDYAETNRRARTEPFARMLHERAGAANTVWVVWAPAYRTFASKCSELLEDLRGLRTEDRPVHLGRRTFERPGLVRYAPPDAVPDDAGPARAAGTIAPRA